MFDRNVMIFFIFQKSVSSPEWECRQRGKPDKIFHGFKSHSIMHYPVKNSRYDYHTSDTYYLRSQSPPPDFGLYVESIYYEYNDLGVYCCEYDPESSSHAMSSLNCSPWAMIKTPHTAFTGQLPVRPVF